MNMSTGLASMGLDHGPKCVTYSISKAALNMLVMCYIHVDIKTPKINLSCFMQTYKQSREEPEIIAVVVDPGWVKTG